MYDVNWFYFEDSNYVQSFEDSSLRDVNKFQELLNR
jgi:hypothetical protein